MLHIVEGAASAETFPSAPRRFQKTGTTDALARLEELVSLIEGAGGRIVTRCEHFPVLLVDVDPAKLPWHMRRLLRLVP